MKIRSRKVIITSKSVDEILKVLKSAAFLPKGKFDRESFSFFYSRSYNGNVTLVPVKGTIRQEENCVVVTLEIHADLAFYIGNIISLGGVIWLFSKLLTQRPKWYFCVLPILFGLLCSIVPVLVASEILNRLEFKLQR